MTRNFVVRAADPSDAEALTHLAKAVSAEPEAWLISTSGEWRSVRRRNGLLDRMERINACKRGPFLTTGKEGASYKCQVF